MEGEHEHAFDLGIDNFKRLTFSWENQAKAKAKIKEKIRKGWLYESGHFDRDAAKPVVVTMKIAKGES